MRSFIYGSPVALIMLGAPANGAWAEDQAFLTLKEISQTIIDNTMTGQTKDGDAYAEYYAPDGTIHGRSEKGGAYTGSWWLRKEDNLMCFRYGDGPFDAGCVRLSLTGSRVNFVLLDGTTEPSARLVSGNPDSL